MCGIVGYLGKKSVVPLILNSLQTLEYRGYDSAGIAFMDNNLLSVYKASGKLANLRNRLPQSLMESNGHQEHYGIGHTRWATHGAPTDQNAHPHVSCDEQIALIHNGIIENYGLLREELQAKGHVFNSKTDSECVVHLLEDLTQNEPDFMQVLQQLTRRLEGAYALVIIDKRQPGKLFGVRNHAPLVIGIGDDEMLLGSDVVALVEHTHHVNYLRDGEIVELSSAGFRITDFDGQTVAQRIEEIGDQQLVLDKKGYKHFMLKEIYEQPDVVRNSLSGRLTSPDEPVTLFQPDDIVAHAPDLSTIKRICIVACGTSYHAGLVGKYLIEDLVRIPVDVESAGEFRYRNPIIDSSTLVIAISQSGETADTITAVRQSKAQGGVILSVTNREGSTIARDGDYVLPVRAGLEVSVCATKSFTAQVIATALFGLHLAETRHTASSERISELKAALLKLPVQIDAALHDDAAVQAVAHKYGDVRNMIFMARGINWPAAMEGALKLKEISYIHAEGYSASELKHGPIAILERSVPVIATLAPGVLYDKVVSNCQEAKARDAQVVAIHCGPMHEDVRETFEDVLFVPETDELLSPILTSIPMQLLAYHIAEYLGKDVDQPRNLAKSVTVE